MDLTNSNESTSPLLDHHEQIPNSPAPSSSGQKADNDVPINVMYKLLWLRDKDDISNQCDPTDYLRISTPADAAEPSICEAWLKRETNTLKFDGEYQPSTGLYGNFVNVADRINARGIPYVYKLEIEQDVADDNGEKILVVKVFAETFIGLVGRGVTRDTLWAKKVDGGVGLGTREWDEVVFSERESLALGFVLREVSDVDE